MRAIETLKLLTRIIGLVTMVIVLLIAYGVLILVSIPLVIIIFPFALIKAELELSSKKKMNRRIKNGIKRTL